MVAAVEGAAWVLAVEALVVGMLAPVVPMVEATQPYLPAGATSVLVAAMTPAETPNASPISAHGDPVIAALVLVVWTAVALATSVLSLQRRDLT
ncbi:MAG: hypothetical protein Q4D79_10595 [Propionibacteriaceae bacterium]|nr:hypothetical protein [Propionibacteriaceae bacterium]